MDRKMIDEAMIKALSKGKGIVRVCPFPDEDRRKVLEIEQEAEKKSLMGLGKVINSGVMEVLNCDLIYVALTNMDFHWGSYPSLVLKKGQEVVGEMVYDKEVIARLSNQENVWFMHQNFFIYKDKVSFPQDLVKKICHFETPCLPAEWCVVENDELQCHRVIYAIPAVPCDLYLKKQYFNGLEEKGFGTIVVGVKW
jgi:hypothetical protein